MTLPEESGSPRSVPFWRIFMSRTSSPFFSGRGSLYPSKVRSSTGSTISEFSRSFRRIARRASSILRARFSLSRSFFTFSICSIMKSLEALAPCNMREAAARAFSSSFSASFSRISTKASASAFLRFTSARAASASALRFSISTRFCSSRSIAFSKRLLSPET